MDRIEDARQDSCPISPQPASQQNEKSACESIKDKERNAPARVSLAEEKVKGDFEKREDGTTLDSRLVGHETKGPGRDQVDRQFIPVVLDQSGLPDPHRPE